MSSSDSGGNLRVPRGRRTDMSADGDLSAGGDCCFERVVRDKAVRAGALREVFAGTFGFTELDHHHIGHGQPTSH